MNKIIVEVYLPAALRTYDVRIPADVQLFEVTSQVAQALSILSEGLYIATEDALLLERESGSILDINMTAWELGLQNGSRLMLI